MEGRGQAAARTVIDGGRNGPGARDRAPVTADIAATGFYSVSLAAFLGAKLLYDQLLKVLKQMSDSLIFVFWLYQFKHYRPLMATVKLDFTLVLDIQTPCPANYGMNPLSHCTHPHFHSKQFIDHFLSAKFTHTYAEYSNQLIRNIYNDLRHMFISIF